MRVYVPQLICHFGRIFRFIYLFIYFIIFFFSPFAPFCVLAIFVPGKVWDYLCPGIWDHLCPGIWDHLCPGLWDHLCPGIWDHLCPGIWDYLCPVFMELRVHLRCQIVCDLIVLISLCLFHMLLICD